MLVQILSRQGLLLAALLSVSACGGQSTSLRAQVRELRQQVAELNERNREALRLQAELESRLSQVSSTQAESHGGRRALPELPTVTLQPGDPAHTTATTRAGRKGPAEVEFAGAARSEQPERVRTLLRAEGEHLAEEVSGSGARRTLPLSEAPARPRVRRVGSRVETTLDSGETPASPAAEARVEAPPAAPTGSADETRAQQSALTREARTTPLSVTPGTRRRSAAPLAVIAPSGDNLGVLPVPRIPPGGGIEAASPVRGAAPAIDNRGTGAAPAIDSRGAGAALAIDHRGAGAAPAIDHRGAGAALAINNRGTGAPLGRVTADTPEAQSLYQQAQERIRGGRYAEAEQDLREFVRRFPRHDFADNAQYWLGETFYARKQYSEAVASFRAVVERWPTGNKAPDALLKLGFSLVQQGEKEKGRAVLTQVISNYPQAPAAQLAQRRLGELGGAGQAGGPR